MSKKPRKLIADQLLEIKELYKQGLSSYAIAKKMGIPSGVVRYHVKRAIPDPVKAEKIIIAPDRLSMYILEIQTLKQKNKILTELLLEHLKP